MTTAYGQQELMEEITIAGRPVRLRHIDLPINEVRLDPKNQRVQFIVSLFGRTPTEEEIAQKLWALDDVKDLYRIIKANQGLLERIIVRADGTIVEGNCRTVVYRRLCDTEGDARWAKIPSRVLPGDITDKEIAYLLGELHVAGKNEWTAFEQAAYVYRMNNEHAYSVDALAEHLRMGKTKINQRIWAYTLMSERYLRDSTEPTDLQKWSYFEEFYKAFKNRQNAQPWEDMFLSWVREGKLDKGAQVRDLSRIVADPEALQALKDRSYDEAMLILGRHRPELSSRFFRLVDRVIEEVRDMPASEIRLLQAGDTARIAMLRELSKALRELEELAGVSLS